MRQCVVELHALQHKTTASICVRLNLLKKRIRSRSAVVKASERSDAVSRNPNLKRLCNDPLVALLSKPLVCMQRVCVCIRTTGWASQ